MLFKCKDYYVQVHRRFVEYSYPFASIFFYSKLLILNLLQGSGFGSLPVSPARAPRAYGSILYIDLAMDGWTDGG